MSEQSLDKATAGPGGFSPAHLIRNPLISASEKIQLLTALKARVSGRAPNADRLGFSVERIDAAISEIARDNEDVTLPPARRD